MTTSIPFSRLPGFTKLFLDYVAGSGAAMEFFRRPPRLDAVRSFAAELSARSGYARPAVASILRRQNEEYAGGPEALRNIDALAEPDSVAVVTGQQLGLFTGPLYTVYKALTAVRLAEELRSGGVRAVPVFWMEGEDHDLAEVTRFTLASRDGSLRTVDYRPLLFGEVSDSARPVASIRFQESIECVVAQLEDTLPDTEWKAAEVRRLRSVYRAGASFVESFGSLMARLFEAQGLVLFDPSDLAAKRLAAPLFAQVVGESARTNSRLRERNSKLTAAGYHSQVAVQENATVLFFHRDGQRLALVLEHGRFSIKGTDAAFAPGELIRLAENEPERFSSSALLRPILQDFLFPTVAYVGGPAEIAYFAQAEELYRAFDRPMPAIWPRASLTLIEPEIAGLLAQHGIDLEECFGPVDGLTEAMLEKSGTPGASRELRRLAVEMDRALDELRPGLLFAEASLGPALDTAKRKILHNLDTLRSKLVQFESGQNRALAADAARILSACRPNGNYQERELNVIPFLARYGPRLLHRLYDQIDTGRFAHNLITL